MIDCPFCGNEHDSEVTDLSAHFAPYLQGLGYMDAKVRGISPDSVFRALQVYLNNDENLSPEAANTLKKVKMTHLRDGWTGD